jgi:hypothetical protein
VNRRGRLAALRERLSGWSSSLAEARRRAELARIEGRQQFLAGARRTIARSTRGARRGRLACGTELGCHGAELPSSPSGARAVAEHDGPRARSRPTARGCAGRVAARRPRSAPRAGASSRRSLAELQALRNRIHREQIESEKALPAAPCSRVAQRDRGAGRGGQALDRRHARLAEIRRPRRARARARRSARRLDASWLSGDAAAAGPRAPRARARRRSERQRFSPKLAASAEGPRARRGSGRARSRAETARSADLALRGWERSLDLLLGDLPMRLLPAPGRPASSPTLLARRPAAGAFAPLDDRRRPARDRRSAIVAPRRGLGPSPLAGPAACLPRRLAGADAERLGAQRPARVLTREGLAAGRPAPPRRPTRAAGLPRLRSELAASPSAASAARIADATRPRSAARRGARRRRGGRRRQDEPAARNRSRPRIARRRDELAGRQRAGRRSSRRSARSSPPAAELARRRSPAQLAELARLEAGTPTASAPDGVRRSRGPAREREPLRALAPAGAAVADVLAERLRSLDCSSPGSSRASWRPRQLRSGVAEEESAALAVRRRELEDGDGARRARAAGGVEPRRRRGGRARRRSGPRGDARRARAPPEATRRRG